MTLVMRGKVLQTKAESLVAPTATSEASRRLPGESYFSAKAGTETVSGTGQNKEGKEAFWGEEWTMHGPERRVHVAPRQNCRNTAEESKEPGLRKQRTRGPLDLWRSRLVEKH